MFFLGETELDCFVDTIFKNDSAKHDLFRLVHTYCDKLITAMGLIDNS